MPCHAMPFVVVDDDEFASGGAVVHLQDDDIIYDMHGSVAAVTFDVDE